MTSLPYTFMYAPLSTQCFLRRYYSGCTEVCSLRLFRTALRSPFIKHKRTVLHQTTALCNVESLITILLQRFMRSLYTAFAYLSSIFLQKHIIKAFEKHERVRFFSVCMEMLLQNGEYFKKTVDLYEVKRYNINC